MSTELLANPDVTVGQLPTWEEVVATGEVYVDFPCNDRVAAKTGELPTFTSNQMGTMVRYAHENLLVTQTWGEAMALMQAKYCVGNQNPYSIVSGILEEAAEANKGATPTAAQQGLVTSLIAVLSGQEKHWDVHIAANVATTTPAVKQTLMLGFIQAQNRGQVQASIDRFNAIFGRPMGANTAPPVDPSTDEEVAEEDKEEAF